MALRSGLRFETAPFPLVLHSIFPIRGRLCRLAGGLGCLSLFWAAPAFAETLYGVPPLTVDARHDGYALGPYLEILEDRDRSLTIERVASPEFAEAFAPAREPVPNFSYTDSAYWVRLRIARAEDAGREWLLECALPAMDSMRLYRRTADGWVMRETGDMMPFDERELRHRNGVLRLRLSAEAHEPEVFYLRFATQGIVQLSLALWSLPGFAEKVGQEQYGFGLYYGLLLAMMIYNLFLFFAVGDRSYLFYVLYILSFTLTIMCVNGLAFQYLWPDSPLWANRSLVIFLGLSCAAVIMFGRDFLKTGYNVVRLDPLLKILATLSLVLALVSPFFPYRITVRIAISMTPLVGSVLFYCGFLVWRDGFRPARYFLMAWAGLLLGVLAFVLKNFDVLPAVFLTEYGLQIGSALEVLLLSLALGDRIKVLRREKNEASRALNESLEEQVGLRTRELNRALLELRKAHAELQEKDYYIQNELDLAAKIQRGILPPPAVTYNGIQVLTYYDSFDKVGGDFLAIEPTGKDRLAIFIADVSGHGIPAALLTTITRIGFSEALGRFSSPAEILADINVSMRHTVKSDDFLTAFCVIIEPDLRLVYSSAGHHHGFLLRRGPGVADRMETPGAVIGLVDDLTVPFVDKFDRLVPGDRMFLFTDGIVEANNIKDEVFGRRRLFETLMESLELPLEEQKAWLLRRWKQFTGPREVQDDVSFILLEVGEVAAGDGGATGAGQAAGDV